MVAAVAVAGFFGTAVIAPLTMPSALAVDAEFTERIHQEFVPEDVDSDVEDLAINLAVAPLEEEPKPEPVAAPAAASVSAGPPKYTGGGAPAEWMAAAGIPESDWWYVDQIVVRESGWNPNAVNPGSGASGLVQALPCGKVPGNCFNPVDNLRWASGYAAGRYGSWAGAHAFWEANHWW